MHSPPGRSPSSSSSVSAAESAEKKKSAAANSHKKGSLVYHISMLFVGVAILAAYHYKTIYRLVKVVTLFHPNYIVANFQGMDTMNAFPYRVIKRGESSSELVHYQKNVAHFPSNFVYEGEVYNIDAFLNDTWTTGLVVLKADKGADASTTASKAHVLYEKYFRGATHETRTISWSVGKSFVSALFGIAFHEGLIHSLEDDVVKYAPEFKGSGYDGVKLKDVLQMSSGVKFNEDYGDFYSDINVMGRTLALGTPINQFAASLQREREPGTYNHYISMDTQVVGAVLSNVVKETYGSMSKYLEEKIWKKVGFEQDSFWLLDNDEHQMELAFGTINAVPRDFARFGLLYLNEGRSPLSGEQLVHPDWVRDSVTPDAPHLMPGWGNPQSPAQPFGYGYQWWIPGSGEDYKGKIKNSKVSILLSLFFSWYRYSE